MKLVRLPGVAPGLPPWRGGILLLNHNRTKWLAHIDVDHDTSRNMVVPMNRMEASTRVHKLWLALECGALFLGVPGAQAAGWLPVPIIPLLLFMAGGCWLALRWHHQIAVRDLMRPKVPGFEWRRILVVYAASIPCLLLLLWAIKPDALFSLLRLHPKIWLLVMFAYPVISVFPQELIYRAFFFERYRPLFGSGVGLVVASAAAFGFAHVVFHNWPAIVLTFLGGVLFAKTYQRTSSLLAVAIEHALYGCAIFTIGYGEFFYGGTMQAFLHRH